MQIAANTTATSPINYNPYGYSKMLIQGPYTSGFNGAYFDIHTHGYHLGQGYRMYSPALPRFTSPDFLSPFGRGGINAYAYCNGDPVNRIDPNGAWSLTGALKWIGTRGLRKHNKIDMNLAREGIQQAGRNRTAAIINGNREHNMQAMVLHALEDVSSRAPHILDIVAKHLPPSALNNAATRFRRGGPLHKLTQRLSDKAYLQHHDNILLGKETNYRTDGRLTHLEVLYLERLEEGILRANRPYTLADSDPLHANPGRYLEISIKYANEIRRGLAGLQNGEA